ncbi:MAG TPA: AMP-binding protein, partial [Thermomicrobiales bacterium]|nr:AMP-binding protein [Thermomicrobiales bacterium]
MERRAAAVGAMPVGHDRASDEIVWRPNDDYVRRSRLRRFMNAQGVASFEALLERAATDPAWFWDATIKDLDLQFYTPYTSVLDQSRGLPWTTWFPGGEYNWVHNAVDKYAAGPQATKTALIWEGDDGAKRQLTYQELRAEADRLAGALAALGVAKGDRIGIFMPMLPETVVATIAAGKLGAIYIPIFSGYGAESVATRLRDAEAVCLITADGFYRRGGIVPMKATADAALATAPTIKHVVVCRRLGDGRAAMAAGRDVWWDEIVAGQPAEFATAHTAAEDPFMIIYTSGTTGRPKGALHIHAGFPIKAVHDLAYCFDVQEDDVVFWLSDLGWMMGPWLIFAALINQAAMALYVNAPKDRAFGEFVERAGVTMLGLVQIG